MSHAPTLAPPSIKIISDLCDDPATATAFSPPPEPFQFCHNYLNVNWTPDEDDKFFYAAAAETAAAAAAAGESKKPTRVEEAYVFTISEQSRRKPEIPELGYSDPNEVLIYGVLPESLLNDPAESKIPFPASSGFHSNALADAHGYSPSDAALTRFLAAPQAPTRRRSFSFEFAKLGAIAEEDGLGSCKPDSIKRSASSICTSFT